MTLPQPAFVVRVLSRLVTVTAVTAAVALVTLCLQVTPARWAVTESQSQRRQADADLTPAGAVEWPEDDTLNVIQETVSKARATNREASQVYQEKYKVFFKDDVIPSEVKVLSRQRKILLSELTDYPLHPSLGVNDVEALVPELGGRPVRNIIVTTWRSGSTFLGDVLQAHPATYYHYEPLLDFEIQQVRHGQLAEKAIGNLGNLLRCNYSGMDHLLTYGQTHPWLMMHNTRLWWICFAFRKFCAQEHFLTSFCRLFPFQSMKVVRLRMNLTETFLNDDELSVRVLLLVRDPRGTMQSRRHRDWCPDNPDCYDPSLLCSDLVSDYYAAVDMAKRYPKRVRVIRYEDLSFNVYNLTRELFDFFRLSYVSTVDKFLKSHTKQTMGDVSSTFRDSKVAPVHWKTDLTFEEVIAIQDKCEHAMLLYGYRRFDSPQQLAALNTTSTFFFPYS